MTMRLSVLASGALVGVLMLCLPAAAVAALSPTITFAKQAVVASGMTPGGKVVWFGVARQIEERMAPIVRRENIAEDDDRDGAVRLELDREVPFQSIWVAIDLETGAAAVATPKDYPLRRIELSPGSAGRGEGKPDWVEDDRGFVEILLVRPREGAWGATVGDGGASDDDQAYDGRLMASLPRMRGVGVSRPAAAPERFSPSDVLVVIDPNEMVVGLRQLAGVPQ